MTKPTDRRGEARDTRYSPCLIRDENGQLHQGVIGDTGSGGVQIVDASELLQVGQKVRVFSLPASINTDGYIAWRHKQAAGVAFVAE